MVRSPKAKRRPVWIVSGLQEKLRKYEPLPELARGLVQSVLISVSVIKTPRPRIIRQ